MALLQIEETFSKKYHHIFYRNCTVLELLNESDYFTQDFCANAEKIP